jgi:ubiquinone/menaquinone biosynthesis C-methylase UbiE
MMGSTNFYSDGDFKGRPNNSVDEFFHEHSQYWKEVYESNTLSAIIYRERRSAVLSMVDRLQLPIRSRVLEVGCGAGSTSVALARKGYRVNAVDTVEGMLELTRQATNEAGVDRHLEVSSADVCQLSFPSLRFALALAVGVFAWLEEPRQALTELYRVTRPGGYLIITATNSWALNQVLDPVCFPGLRPMRWQIAEVLEKFNLWRRSRPRQHRYSVKQIDSLLSETGFHKLTGRTLGFGPFTIFRHNLLPEPGEVNLHQRLQALADRQFPLVRSGGVVYVVLARKV